MSLQPTPSHVTLPSFDEEPDSKTIRRLGLRPWHFDDKGNFITMPRQTAVYLTSKKPGDQLDAGVFGIESLARFGPTGYIYEVGSEVGQPRTFWAGPMLNRMAAAISLVRPDRLPGATTNAVVQIESAFGEHRYVLVTPDTHVPITLAEWNLISIPLMFAQAVTVTPAAEVAASEDWPTGSIGPVVESKRSHVTGVVTS